MYYNNLKVYLRFRGLVHRTSLMYEYMNGRTYTPTRDLAGRKKYI